MSLDQRHRHVPCPALTILLLFTLAPLANAQSDFQGATHLMPFDEETINYTQAKEGGPVACLQAQIDSGKAKLEYDPKFGYLPSVLAALHVSKESQMLVFSKTSFQRERISPQSPRAIFFNDQAYVGFIPGAPLIEVSAVDPKLGAVFYTLDQKPTEKPRFVRTDQCLECHASSKNLGVPGHLVRSFVTDDNGVVDLSTGVSPVTHRTPLAERWGGWYVTGTTGNQPHHGNLVGRAAFEQHEKDPSRGGNITNLSPFFDTSRYLSPGSDIVALMVLEHQTHMHNFITRLNYAGTLAIQQYGHVNYLKSATDAFLKYLLFTEETPLTAPIKGTSHFADQFTAAGRKDEKGRSLREFDLQTRLFKYPCSYLIYSEVFDALPDKLKESIYHRLYDILTGKDTSSDFGKITAGNKQAIVEILTATRPGLPPYWKKS